MPGLIATDCRVRSFRRRLRWSGQGAVEETAAAVLERPFQRPQLTVWWWTEMEEVGAEALGL